MLNNGKGKTKKRAASANLLFANQKKRCAVRAICFFLLNRPFYRYGGHIELIRFKEYYRMPRGHEHISFVFLSAFRDIFS